jgi:hypothetical protein
MAGPAPPRRIVTALREDGRSYLARIEEIPADERLNISSETIARSYPNGPPAVHTIWSCDRLPFELPADPLALPSGAHPGPLGLRVSVTVFPPGWNGEMFWSDRVDVLWMMAGTLRYVTDSGDEVLFGPGDIVIQNGTSKAFVNAADEPAMMGCVLCGAVRAGATPPAERFHGAEPRDR